MKTTPPVWLLLLFTFVLPASLARALETSSIESLGNDTYSVTASATTKFTRNTAKLKAAAIDAATQFCAKEGRQFKLLSVGERKSMYMVGDMATTKITFKALKAGDPELAPAPGETARPVVAAAPAPTPAPLPAVTADVLSSELTKLDELRKKGLLTDEEFTLAKKKLLDRM